MKLVHGVGINDLRDDPSYITIKKIGGKTVWECPFYKKWASLLRRCYNERCLQRRPQYRDCSVCEEWKTFSNFMAWMKTQSWEGKEIDKDILVPGNKVYSPETCVFVSRNVNVLLCNSLENRGKCPVGVRFNVSIQKYTAQMSRYSKNIHLGTFDTPEEAHEVYKKERTKYILEVAENLTEDDTSDIERTRQGLIRHVEEGHIFE
tara:strand:- start:103 stop:717 length:615 start_codon:yes stop_codon:yes gene_type:complete